VVGGFVFLPVAGAVIFEKGYRTKRLGRPPFATAWLGIVCVTTPIFRFLRSYFCFGIPVRGLNSLRALNQVLPRTFIAAVCNTAVQWSAVGLIALGSFVWTAPRARAWRCPPRPIGIVHVCPPIAVRTCLAALGWAQTRFRHSTNTTTNSTISSSRIG